MTKQPFDMNQHPFDTVHLEIISQFLKFIDQIGQDKKEMKEKENQNTPVRQGVSFFSNKNISTSPEESKRKTPTFK